MGWIPKTLRGTPVFARSNADGKFAADAAGRVEVRYQNADGAKTYRANRANLEDSPETSPETSTSGAVAPIRTERVEKGHGKDAVVVYTDGACSGNPGPMGAGVVIVGREGENRREISQYLGVGTNNIAELSAVECALDALADLDKSRSLVVHADSTYVIGVLARGFKAKANAELVQRIREKCRRFPKLQFVKVEGHAGVPENERADELARAGVSGRR